MLTSPVFYRCYVKLPRSDHTPPEIRRNTRFYPFFRRVLGAIDCTHLAAFISEELAAAFRNRKGFLSQNVFTVSTFDLRFAYVLPGWEGSAADACIFQDSRNTNFAIKPGTSYLADAGFPSCNALLVPYHGVRYHLKEWERVGNK